MKIKSKIIICVVVALSPILFLAQNCGSSGYRSGSVNYASVGVPIEAQVELTPENPPPHAVDANPLPPPTGVEVPVDNPTTGGGMPVNNPPANTCKADFIFDKNRFSDADFTSGPNWNRIVSNDQYILIVSTCGVFVSLRNTKQFKPLKLSILNGYKPDTFYLDGDLLYFANLEGFFRLNLKTYSYQRLLDNPKVQALLNTTKLVAGVGLGISFTSDRSFARGDLIFMMGAGGPYVSTDAGVTWKLLPLQAGNYSVPSGATRDKIVFFNNKIYFVQDISFYASEVINLTTNQRLSSSVSRPGLPETGGVFSYNPGDNVAKMISYPESALAGSVAVVGNELYARMSNIGSGRAQDFIYLIKTSDGLNWQPVFKTSVNKSIYRFNILNVGGKPYGFWNGFDKLYALEDGIPTSENTKNIPLASSLEDLDSQGNEIFYLDNAGDVYFANETSKIFQKNMSFSSRLCVHLNQVALSGSSGQSIVAKYNNNTFFMSTNAGSSFQKLPYNNAAGANGLYESTNEPLLIDQTFLHAGFSAQFLSTDLGLSWAVPTLPYQIPTTQIEINKTGGTQGEGLLVSYSNGMQARTEMNLFINQQKSKNLPWKVTDGISVGGNTVLALFEGGIVTLKNGSVIYSNDKIYQSGGLRWIRLFYIDNILYAAGDRLWRSKNNGVSFEMVPDAPRFAIYVFKMGAKHGLVGHQGRIYLSDAQFENFEQLTGCLQNM